MRASQILRLSVLLMLGGCDAMMYRPFAPGNVFNRDGTLLTGAPSGAEQSTADYGEQPTRSDAEKSARSLMQSILKDPMSAVWECSDPERGYIGSSAWGGKIAYGWLLACNINSKNSYGAYIGAQRYGFVVHNGSITRAAIFSGGTQQVVYQAFQ